MPGPPLPGDANPPAGPENLVSTSPSFHQVFRRLPRIGEALDAPHPQPLLGITEARRIRYTGSRRSRTATDAGFKRAECILASAGLSRSGHERHRPMFSFDAAYRPGASLLPQGAADRSAAESASSP